MFGSKCPRCGSRTKSEWEFCPKCGFRFRSNNRDVFETVFDQDFFEDFNKEMERMIKDINKQFRTPEKNLEVINLKPMFRSTRPTGFQIKIVTGNSGKPKIDVKTFGNVDKNQVEREVCDQLGVKPVPVGPKEQREQRSRPTPKATEEPKCEVRRINDKFLVNVQLPGVRSADDIDIKDLENSVEIKALCGEKAYFKILTKPQKLHLKNYSFDKGILNLEFG
jgi:HSP20 family molecular chaperone IbpA